MMEATCTACGNINRVADGDVAPGARFVNCASCKARVALPTKTEASAPPPPPTPVDLIDLPAPKRASPLGSEPSRPAPRSGLAAATEASLDDMPFGDVDLPAPRGPTPIAARPPSPPPIPAEPGLADLPAPKAKVATGRVETLPAFEPARTETTKTEMADLPAPKAKLPIPKLPTPAAGAPAVPATPSKPAMPPLPPSKLGGLGDLPAPRATRDAPKPGLGDLPTPRTAPGLGDLPMPKPAKGRLDDLPMPKPGLGDLPTPKAFGDPPAPRPARTSDLPAPKGASNTDLLTPRPGAELPAPKGFFDDLPQPATSTPPVKPELPAPKGFFDDLPQPATNKPAGKPELPAPKGFFEDLPGKVNPNRQVGPEVPAPKGFFEDLPGKPNQAKPAGRPDLPAPKGFFDDLPGKVNPNRPMPPEVPAPKGFFDDLPQPSRGQSQRLATAAQPLVDLSEAAPLDPGPDIDLHADAEDLSPPISAPATAPPGMQFRAPRAKGESLQPEGLRTPAIAKGAEVTLELDEPRAPVKPSKKLEQKRRREPSFDPIDVKRRARRIRLLALGGVLVLALGGGGFMMYRRHLEKVERDEAVSQAIGDAKRALAAKDPKRWDKAARAAKKALELDETNGEALGIAAEAQLADGLANGINGPSKFGQAKRMLATALEKGVNNPGIERAQALSQIAGPTKQPERALARLQPLATRAPKDATLALYLGWAHAANGDMQNAIAAFTTAAGDDQVKIPALYGRARAKLAQADLEGARTDFTAVLDVAKDHIAAQVGLAIAQPAAQAQQQEADLLAILERKDLASGDPRAVVEAWSLAADAARRSGRLDVARDRYGKAAKLAPTDLGVLAGQAEVDLRDGKLDAASETITKALTLSPSDLRAQLVAAQIAIRQKRLDDAETRVQTLAARTPAPPALDLARIKMVSGELLEARGSTDAAVDAYVEAAKLAGEVDLEPSLVAVAKLGALAEAAARDKEDDKAATLRARAEQLIGALADNAQRDPHLALTLGVAYLQAGDAGKAEPWLRRVVELRPSDPEAHYQLARALVRLDRIDDGIERLRRAIDLAPARVEIALELARIYELSARETAANELYAKLLGAKDPVVDVRVRAGRFFSRTQQIDKAAEQGAKILEVEPTNPAGYFLKAEGLLVAGKVEEASKLFRQAVDQDHDPQYLDGQGRAAEAMVIATGDTKFQDAALRAYMAAVEGDPRMFNPLVGQGRLYVQRHEAKKAVPPLIAAQRLRGDDAQVAKLLGLAYKELQETKVAIDWLARSYKLHPDAETAWSLGQLLVDANQPAAAVTALNNATRLAFETEKQSGKQVLWLTDALHKLGRIELDQGHEAQAKAAWEKYVGRNPKGGAQLDEVRRQLATTLQRY